MSSSGVAFSIRSDIGDDFLLNLGVSPARKDSVRVHSVQVFFLAKWIMQLSFCCEQFGSTNGANSEVLGLRWVRSRLAAIVVEGEIAACGTQVLRDLLRMAVEWVTAQDMRQREKATLENTQYSLFVRLSPN
jgi:hypothetical protein